MSTEMTTIKDGGTMLPAGRWVARARAAWWATGSNVGDEPHLIAFRLARPTTVNDAEKMIANEGGHESVVLLRVRRTGDA